ncbi:hydrogenase assembly chaperone HypC/HupF [Hyphomicrobium denitrificans 1NES1]|uniref:Hydrogenase assembly chaperone HypC/HupF n=1 Tax=Hyphomicrobium denitrificans 1NES1 TaxID=670307 RepID=N0BB41_9HYPH|nr:HypC/HybG/HupF family hydrogenase formation chaperone [Hyphomicrobium denitrificans]AGK57340.1 hydrogenase assembly chaperone HypC/HupF [Hyphomicrobium denitrificans 1NES1]
MCIGVPMCVVECLPGRSVCERQGERRLIDMALVGEQPVGTWVLVFLDTARELVTGEQARLIDDALTALQFAMEGGTDLDRLFPDLAGREPELPAYLKQHLAKQAG